MLLQARLARRRILIHADNLYTALLFKFQRAHAITGNVANINSEIGAAGCRGAIYRYCSRGARFRGLLRVQGSCHNRSKSESDEYMLEFHTS